MSANIIDGKALAAGIRQEIRSKIQNFTDAPRPPCLAVILVGDNPASQIYVRNKIKACLDTGITSLEKRLLADASEAELLSLIKELNEDDSVDGILVQLPLPKGFDEQKVIRSIAAEKDVDGIHVENMGALVTGLKGFRCCTPHGVMKMLESVGCPLEGANALVIGRSNIVGKPMALMLLEKNATVTVAHSRTKNLKELAKNADIIVSAVGKAGLVTDDMVKPGAVVIDVGMNRNQEGKLCGDVDIEAVARVAGFITPVPGGVGPMTIAMLLDNTMRAFENRFNL